MWTRDITQNAHQFILSHISNCEENSLNVLDATMGNGNDTLFLASLAQAREVWAFDVQRLAIKNTKENLENKLNILSDSSNKYHNTNIENINEVSIKTSNNTKINLICQSHLAFTDFITDKLDIIMFNLGYLPTSDKKISTEAEITVKTIEKCLKQLNSMGIMTIITYIGHDNGMEYSIIKQYLGNIAYKDYKVLRITIDNASENCPQLFVVIKE
ncbi:MAG: hypothetical protein ATN36_07815 [Epulopiscium sp. Nele67-Bin005]|nr:MAG: hypothetical protein ATN36_07815 [Epulopiscium sp. Nele67-Bin005]